ncbi:uncharacterized protein J3R85_008079 [Psidium guajava]|nr:uncharacterized protein J3R85_008079 [Psidium guajava]
MTRDAGRSSRIVSDEGLEPLRVRLLDQPHQCLHGWGSEPPRAAAAEREGTRFEPKGGATMMCLVEQETIGACVEKSPFSAAPLLAAAPATGFE